MFNEGIDLKTVDCIIFLEDKKSIRNIIQNIGRSLRLDDSKILMNGNYKKSIICVPFGMSCDIDYETTIDI